MSETKLDNFRQEIDGDGLSSYPHPWLMPDYWQFPTVSMGWANNVNLSSSCHEVFGAKKAVRIKS